MTGGIQALRRRLAVCFVLALGIAVAGVTMPGPGRSHPAPATREQVATGPTSTIGPTASTTPATAPPSGSTPPTTASPSGSETPVPTTSAGPAPTTSSTTPPPVVPIAPPTTATCGTPIRKAGGGTWRCTFDDEFDGSSVDRTKWRVQETSWNGFHSGSECFVDKPANVSVSGGELHLTVRKEANGFVCQAPKKPYGTQFTSGMLTTNGKFTQAYGRFEFRAKVPDTDIRGLQTAFWLWPQDQYRYGYTWPASGEIDVAEAYSLFPDRVVPYVHYLGTGDDVTNNSCLVSHLGEFHTYTLEWTPDAIRILYDGNLCIENHWSPLFPLQHPAPFDQPFMVSITQALGLAPNTFHDGVTPLPATTTVDYVRIWK